MTAVLDTIVIAEELMSVGKLPVKWQSGLERSMTTMEDESLTFGKGREMIKVPREKLESILKECLEMARPYTGEEWMGKADLANELLGNPPINWEEFIDEQNRVYREDWEKLKEKRKGGK